MNRIGEAPDDKYPMPLSFEFWHQPCAQYRALTDSRSSVQDKRSVRKYLRADGLDFEFPAKEETRVSFSVVVQEFIRTRLREREVGTVISGRPAGSDPRSSWELTFCFDNRADEHVSVFWHRLDIAGARGVIAELF